MATINFSLSKRNSAGDKNQMLLRLSWGCGNALRAKTGIWVYSRFWSDKKQALTIPTIAAPAIREDCIKQSKRLSELKNLILIAASEAPTITKEWLEEVIDKWMNPDAYLPKVDSFFDTFEKFLANRNLSGWRLAAYAVIIRMLKRFELYSKTTLALESVTPETLHAFEVFLQKEHTFFTKDENGKFVCSEKYAKIFYSVPESRTPAPRGKNTISGIFTKLRTFYIWAVNNGKTTNNPFLHFRVEECVYGTPYYISIDERNQIYKTDLSNNPQLAVQRDIFVFQCLIGCRVGDLMRLSKENIINGAIEYIPRKTKEGSPVTVRVPLNSIAQEIVDKYSDFQGGSLFPFVAEQTYNYAIKEIFYQAGITRIVTVLNPLTREEEKRPINEVASSHLARRCFVGNLYKKVKDPNLVGSLSGHKDGSRAFARYRQIDDDIKRELTKMLE